MLVTNKSDPTPEIEKKMYKLSHTTSLVDQTIFTQKINVKYFFGNAFVYTKITFVERTIFDCLYSNLLSFQWKKDSSFFQLPCSLQEQDNLLFDQQVLIMSAF